VATVPVSEPVGTLPVQLVSVPLLVGNFPELPVLVGANALNRALAPACPVPPLAIARCDRLPGVPGRMYTVDATSYRIMP
jgi:hypothetical protein